MIDDSSFAYNTLYYYFVVYIVFPHTIKLAISSKIEIGLFLAMEDSLYNLYRWGIVLIHVYMHTSSHTSGQPVRGNGSMSLEVRLPPGEQEAGRVYEWPTIHRDIPFVSDYFFIK